jgi:hypothetical protein
MPVSYRWIPAPLAKIVDKDGRPVPELFGYLDEVARRMGGQTGIEDERLLFSNQGVYTGAIIGSGLNLDRSTNTLTANAGDGFPEAPLDGRQYGRQMAQWTVISTTGTTTVPGDPVTSVQFNRAGTFGGDADLTWLETSNFLTILGSAGARIKGDLYNATQGLRLLFENSGTDLPSLVGVVPSGTERYSGFSAFGRSSAANCAVVQMTIDDVLPAAVLETFPITGGTARPLLIRTGNTSDTCMSFWPNQNIRLGGSFADGGYPFYVDGVSFFASELITAASNTGFAGLRLPHGVAPTTPLNGNLWTTTAGLFARINGVTIGPYIAGSGVADADYGDVTVSGAGTIWTIDNDVVTYAKMQNVSAADKLLGRGNGGGAGDVQEITLGTNLSMTGTTLNVSGAAAVAGANTQIQFNDSGAFGADADFTWDKTNNYLAVNGRITVGSITVPGWASGYKTIMLGRPGNAIFASDTDDIIGLSSNLYFDATNWKYGSNDTASLLNIASAGTISYQTAGSGTAGNNATLTTRFQWDNSATKFLVTGNSEVDGNFTLTGASRRIIGDFTNATLISRTSFQTSTVNGATYIQCIANGSGGASGAFFFGSNDPTNTHVVGMFIDANEGIIQSFKVGTGTAKPLQFYDNTGARAARIFVTSGNWVFGTSTAETAGAEKVQINGSLSINNAVMIRTYTAFTNGAAAAAGTLLNAPAAGNPTKWIPVNDNGTTRYIPAW